MSKEWSVDQVHIDSTLATLASAASSGHIGTILVYYGQEELQGERREDVRRVWESSSLMRIYVQGKDGWESGFALEMWKDQPGDPEVNWQTLVEIAGWTES